MATTSPPHSRSSTKPLARLSGAREQIWRDLAHGRRQRSLPTQVLSCIHASLCCKNLAVSHIIRTPVTQYAFPLHLYLLILAVIMYALRYCYVRPINDALYFFFQGTDTIFGSHESTYTVSRL